MNFFDKPKFYLVAIVLLLLLNLATLAFLWTGRGMHRGPENVHFGPNNGEMREHERGPGGPGEFLVHELNFNDDQKKALHKLRDEQDSTMHKLHDDMKKSKDALYGALTSGETDQAKIDQLADNVAKSQKQIELATYAHFQKVRALCTDEQKKKFDSIIGDVLKMMAGMPPPDGGPPMMRDGMPPPR